MSGFFATLKAVGGALSTATIATCTVITTTANAANEVAEAAEKGGAWLNGQAGKMLAEMAVEVAQERDWPSKTPQDIAKALMVLKSMGRTLSEKEAALLENYNVTKTDSPSPQQAIIPPTQQPT